MHTVGQIFLQSAIKRLSYYKELGDKTLAVLHETDFYFQPDPESNSIATIIQHLSGNMISRWTDFLTSDGEKQWRDRDQEFENSHLTRVQLLSSWEKGWNICLSAIGGLTEADLSHTIYIRSEGLTVIDAINRQLAHYPYHVGQIIYVAKMIKKQEWKSLSIPKNQSNLYNASLNAK